MPVQTEMPLVTADDLLEMPDDNWSYELVAGRLVRMPKPGPLHGLLSLRLTRVIDACVEAHGSAMVFPQDTGFLLRQNPDTVRAPDVSFVARPRIPTSADPEKFWPVSPDVVVEILSPSDRASNTREKVRDYLECGTRLVWVVNWRRRTATIHRADGSHATSGEADTLHGEDVLPGFRFRVAGLFQGAS